MSIPLLSIIVPVYNAVSYLDTSIQSILDQQYTDWELILIDDGSTDASLEVCKLYAANDERIIVFTKQNGGQGSARNVGLKNAKGKYIAFLDSDDSLSVDCLKENMEILLRNPLIAVLQFPIYMQYTTSNAHVLQYKPEWYHQEDLKALWLDKDIISWIVCNKIFSKQVIQDIFFEEDMIYEDNYFVVSLMEKLPNIYISDKGMYYYYVRNNSTTTSTNTAQKEKDTLRVLKKVMTMLDPIQDFALYSKYLVRIINVEKSLKVNFNQHVSIASSFIKGLSFGDIFKSGSLSATDKVKLLLNKLF